MNEWRSASCLCAPRQFHNTGDEEHVGKMNWEYHIWWSCHFPLTRPCQIVYFRSHSQGEEKKEIRNLSINNTNKFKCSPEFKCDAESNQIIDVFEVHSVHSADRFLEDWSCIFSYSRDSPEVRGNLRLSNCFVFALRQWMTALNSADRRWNQASATLSTPRAPFFTILFSCPPACGCFLHFRIIVPQAPPCLKLSHNAFCGKCGG